MTTATVHIFEGTGAATGGNATTNTDVDALTLKFGLADAQDASGSPISVPANPGNNYSWAKALFLDITVAATTSANLLNRKVKYDTVPTGLNYFFKAVTKGSYVANTAAADTGNASANGTAPTGYAAITTTATAYGTQANQASTATGQNGDYCYVAAGVAGNYAAGGGLSAATVLTMQYDEA